MEVSVKDFATMLDEAEDRLRIRCYHVPAGMMVMWGVGNIVKTLTREDDIEVWAPDGAEILVDKTGVLDEDAPVERENAAAEIEAVRDANRMMEWRVKLDVPHCTFSIVRNGDVVSRGAVFLLADCVRAPVPQPEPVQ